MRRREGSKRRKRLFARAVFACVLAPAFVGLPYILIYYQNRWRGAPAFEAAATATSAAAVASNELNLPKPWPSPPLFLFLVFFFLVFPYFFFFRLPLILTCLFFFFFLLGKSYSPPPHTLSLISLLCVVVLNWLACLFLLFIPHGISNSGHTHTLTKAQWPNWSLSLLGQLFSSSLARSQTLTAIPTSREIDFESLVGFILPNSTSITL